MERMVSFLIFAVLFYLMMRFGCGAHAVHGHHRSDKEGPGTPEDSHDPVCGVNVVPGEGYAKSYKGRNYRFCSQTCLDEFEAHSEYFSHTRR